MARFTAVCAFFLAFATSAAAGDWVTMEIDPPDSSINQIATFVSGQAFTSEDLTLGEKVVMIGTLSSGSVALNVYTDVAGFMTFQDSDTITTSGFTSFTVNSRTWSAKLLTTGSPSPQFWGACCLLCGEDSRFRVCGCAVECDGQSCCTPGPNGCC